MLAAEGNNVLMDLGWTLQWHLAWMQQCQARWGLDKATENFYHHEFIMRKICETMILTAELTWNYILYGFAFCLEGIWDVDACCSSLHFNSFSQAEQDKVGSGWFGLQGASQRGAHKPPSEAATTTKHCWERGEARSWFSAMNPWNIIEILVDITCEDNSDLQPHTYDI